MGKKNKKKNKGQGEPNPAPPGAVSKPDSMQPPIHARDDAPIPSLVPAPTTGAPVPAAPAAAPPVAAATPAPTAPAPEIRTPPPVSPAATALPAADRPPAAPATPPSSAIAPAPAQPSAAPAPPAATPPLRPPTAPAPNVPLRLDPVPAGTTAGDNVSPWALVAILAFLAALILFFGVSHSIFKKTGALPGPGPGTAPDGSAFGGKSNPVARDRRVSQNTPPQEVPAARPGNHAPPARGGPPANPAPQADGSDRNATDRIASRLILPAEQIDDPSKDGWDTEVFAEHAKAQLDRLAKTIPDPAARAGLDLSRLATPSFHTAGLRPEPLQTAYTDAFAVVRRSVGPSEFPAQPDLDPLRGPEGLREALARQGQIVAGASSIRHKFKIYRVVPGQGHTDTLVDFQIYGRTASGSTQVNSIWQVRWVAGPDATTPLVAWIGVPDYEEIESRTAQGDWFSDITLGVLKGNRAFDEHLMHGYNHWWTRVESAVGFQIFSRCGLAIGDANGDGLEDVYVCQPSGLPNRLFVQNPDGTVTDRSSEAGIDFLDLTSSALFLDLDGDGDQDLALAMLECLLVLENDGSGRFRIAASVKANPDTQSMCAADYDLDGDLDLFVCVNDGWQVGKPQITTGTFVYHDATDGGPNHLFRNDGGWTFTDVTAECGLEADNRRHSLAACWEDFDDDGDPDLYVANDYGPNNLWRNDGGKFVDVGRAAGAEDFGSGMSAHWGDFDRDGRFDIYVANMWSSAGGRVTYNEKFRPFEDPGTKRRWQRFAKGNTLLRNHGDGRFEEVSAEAAVEMGRWAWGSNFADLNNDGWEDLLVANGYLTMEDPADL